MVVFEGCLLLQATIEIVKNKMIHSGDNIVLVGFGGGLTWGAILLKWL